MGEPLLHPHLAEILERAEKLKFRVMITTNGTLLGEREDLLWFQSGGGEGQHFSSLL